MIKVSIRGDDWSVSATVRDEYGRNEDERLACAIEEALMCASYCLGDLFYVLAKVLIELDQSLDGSRIKRLREVHNTLIQAALLYCKSAERPHEQKKET